MANHLSLRSRLAILAALTTALTATAVALFGYGLARRSVLNEVDASLVRDQQRYSRRLLTTGGNLGLGSELSTTPVALVNGDAKVLRSTTTGAISFRPIDIEIAQGKQTAQFSERTIDQRTYRFYTAPAHAPINGAGRLARFDRANGGPGLAIAVGRDIEVVRDQLRRLAIGFGLLAGGGVTLSAIAALLAVRVGTRPLKELNEIVHTIATDGDSPREAPTNGPPDIAELSTSFNAMVENLRESRLTQQRMIDDAAHELRTPITSMQTNLDILARATALDPETRSDIVSALLNQFQELRVLVDDLGLLAEQHPQRSTFVSVNLAEVAGRAIERAERRSTSVKIRSDLQAFSIVGDPEQLERAIVNVLDNAIKWSPEHGTVSIALNDGVLRIADEGPGVPAHEHSRVFDRFWRATSTRNTPGSGLGLAIVADVVEQHRGEVTFGESDSGGALVTIRLPHVHQAPATSA
jgi:two-component system, OmpR family, sensor histidine kinase MprB